MASISFETPEKLTDAKGEPYFRCKLAEPGFELPVDLEWHPIQGIKPDLSVQKQIAQLREQVLEQILQTKTLFRTPPTLASLQSITPPWGILLHAKKPMEWSVVNQWTLPQEELKQKEALVHIVLKAIEISRSRICPVWGLSIVRLSPEKEGLIDFTFHDTSEDVKSVVSDEFEEVVDETVFQLTNPSEKKRNAKHHIRELLQKAAEARHAVDDAISRFFQEFDLSEDESDFSDSDSEPEN